MIVIPTQAWTIWYYLFITGVMVANAFICTWVYFLPPPRLRSQMMAMMALLFWAIALGWSCIVLATVGFTPILWVLYVQRFAWLLVLSSSMILVDLGVSRLNGHAAQVHRFLHFWERCPKGKTLMYLLLFVTLSMVVT